MLGDGAAELPCATDADRFNRAAVAAYGADVSGDHARTAVLSNEAIKIAERLDDPTCLTWAPHTAGRMTRGRRVARRGRPGAGTRLGAAGADRVQQRERGRQVRRPRAWAARARRRPAF